MRSDPASEIDEFAPVSAKELARFVGENARVARERLFPVGGRTSLHFGASTGGEGRVISTSGLSGVVDYPARDMTITVGAGIRIERLRELLATERQQLPIDISQSQRATLGGVTAANASGSRRFGYGTMRDYVIGIAAVDASGRMFRAGGRVVKNVAGYDLCKLLVGSLGTLAVITELTLKLKPVPESSAMLWAAFSSFSSLDAALAKLSTSSSRPVVLDVLNPAAAKHIAAEARLALHSATPVLVVGVEGHPNDVGWQIDSLRNELEAIARPRMEVVRDKSVDLLTTALTDYQVLSDDPLTFQASLLPSRAMSFAEEATRLGCAVQAHAGNGIAIGHFPDDVATIEQAEAVLVPLRAAATQGRGNVLIVSCENEWKRRLSVFGEPPSSWGLMRRLKAQLDPYNLLNPGRLFDEGP